MALIMVFSSQYFIFVFLPAVISLYFLMPNRFKNFLLLTASLLFYWIGEHKFFYILPVSVVLNYAIGVMIVDVKKIKSFQIFPWIDSKFILLAGIACNLLILAYFKYHGFISDSVGALLSSFGVAAPPAAQVSLPLGVSFFAFQGISYIIDIYRGDVRPTRSLVAFSTYKTLFPQLIAGPIVRYADVAREIEARTVDLAMMFEGVRRFTGGFVKKVLMADTFGLTTDAIFALDPATLSPAVAWLGAVSYALQIYFDFSAYSDMAIGIGLMFGFRYPENFNYPYISLSIREFWRRWHMSLSLWFRDYVYRPLGGNRQGRFLTYVNLVIVFVLVGLWHGAAWTFVAWGLWHGAFMIIERRFDPDRWPVPAALRHLYVGAVVLFGWVLFRAGTFEQAWHMIARMFGLGGAAADIREIGEFLNPMLAAAIFFGVVFSAPAYAALAGRIPGVLRLPLGIAATGFLFLAACAKVLSGAYSPFLYFRF
jgi:alginate O-acetyltransferase complex protein AlgI